MLSVHKPVLLSEILQAINPKKGATYVDATFGGGGYTRAILESQDCTVLAIDRDPSARVRAEILKQEYPGRFHFFEGCFSEIDHLIKDYSPVNGIVFDFGVSSFQLDEGERGFSFRHDGPLDMRMSQSGLSAKDVVNTYSEEDLAQIIWLYGEETRSRQIARAIVNYRKEKQITSTVELANIVRQIVRRTDGLDPATLTFQGLRIFVNNELIEIDKVLRKCLPFLTEEGRIVTVTFHGLEDRIVKNWFQSQRNQPTLTQTSSLCRLQSIYKKPITPTISEIKGNPRSRSAKLRAFTLLPIEKA